MPGKVSPSCLPVSVALVSGVWPLAIDGISRSKRDPVVGGEQGDERLRFGTGPSYRRGSSSSMLNVSSSSMSRRLRRRVPLWISPETSFPSELASSRMNILGRKRRGLGWDVEAKAAPSAPSTTWANSIGESRSSVGVVSKSFQVLGSVRNRDAISPKAVRPA
ncbi:MAG: hypothetical protein Ct9H300mP1_17220 [Planctomycetaceae bacterium]|nr:MAG: hypothetical protein Ct9H300mP1_17220 [Planctomycetaceae bacterium]